MATVSSCNCVLASKENHVEGAMCVIVNIAVEAVEKEAFGRGVTVLEAGKSLLKRLRYTLNKLTVFILGVLHWVLFS